MRYVLGIHLGATRVTAAVCRHRRGRWEQAEVVPLGPTTPWTDSVLHVSAHGDLLVGQAALRHAATEPERVARAPLHRTGDPVPFVLGDTTYPAETLAAGMIGWVADRVAEVETAHAERIVVTHPPGWSAYRRGLLHQALDAAELPGVLALPSPIAAAENHFARQQVEDVEPGRLLAVCLIGGVHVETALLRRSPLGLELLAHEGSDEHEAGCRLDDLLVRHVAERTETDTGDPFAMSRLRAACIAAKERLSTTPEVFVTDTVSVTRQEFEELARPVLEVAIGRLRRLTSRVPSEQLAAALVAGGSTRIPLVSALARTMLPCPVVVDDDPGTALCRGAALSARPRPRNPRPTQDSKSKMDQASGSDMADMMDTMDTLISTDAVKAWPAKEANSLDVPIGYGSDVSSFDDEEPPPQRPPVKITPLQPPRRRFALARKSNSTDDRDEER